MKKVVLFLIFIICNFCFAQKEITIKNYNTEYDKNCKEITIDGGKPVFIVVCIDNGNSNDSLVGDRELNELKRNFNECNFYYLGLKGKIIIKNSSKETVNFDEVYGSHKKIIYWNGKNESALEVYDKLIESSEYFSKILGLNKVSKYIQAFNNEKNNLKSQLVWNPDVNSKILSDRYTQIFLFNFLTLLGRFEDFFKVNFKGVKKLTIKINY